MNTKKRETTTDGNPNRLGPLSGVRVLELAGLAAAPFGGMLLADLGAEVIRVDRIDARAATPLEEEVPSTVLGRGKQSIQLDLKNPQAREVLLKLCEVSDVLIEPFRPGVVERLGIGPEVCQARNPRLIYARLTGWGQHGPLAAHAGHDLNYIALAGPLAHIGTATEPSIPLNLIGDMGGGGLLLAYGVLAALVERQASGLGQVIDVAMSDGAALLMSMVWEFAEAGALAGRGQNLMDGGDPAYSVYPCADGEFISIASVEPQFFARLCEIAGIEASEEYEARPAALREDLAAMFRTASRDEWVAKLAEETDLCFAPVLSMDEALEHPHHRARETFCTIDGVPQPSVAPRFSRTPGRIRGGPPTRGRDTARVLAQYLGMSAQDIGRLADAGAVGRADLSMP